MNKLIFSGSLASVIFLIVGTFAFPGSDIMWLASVSLAYTIARCIMAAVLITVLLTNPPRKLAVRLLMGVMATVLVGWGGVLIVGNSMHLLDIILFLEVGFAFGLEALELNEDEVDERIERLHHPEQYVATAAIGPFLAKYWQRLRDHYRVEWHII